MARIRTGNAEVEDLPIAYTRGHNKPIGWHGGARCRDERAPHVKPVKGGGNPSVWLVDPDRKYVFGSAVLKGSDLQEMACLECSLCSVQWDCASFAVSVDEPVGVWAMSQDDRAWLQTQADAEKIIRRAESAGRPVQYAVVFLRRRRSRRQVAS
jgi:hypothetical protein